MVVAENSSSQDRKYMDKLGVCESQAKGNSLELSINLERVAYWMNVGAKETGIVAQ